MGGNHDVKEVYVKVKLLGEGFIVITDNSLAIEKALDLVYCAVKGEFGKEVVTTTDDVLRLAVCGKGYSVTDEEGYSVTSHSLFNGGEGVKFNHCLFKVDFPCFLLVKGHTGGYGHKFHFIESMLHFP